MITDYGTLKTAIANWLDRTDLTTKIPDFIQLAEDMIFRELRCPGNEQIAFYPASPTGVAQPGDPAVFDNTIYIDIPKNYLEAKLLMYDDRPLTRVSDQRFAMQNSRVIAGTAPAGTPEEFGRIKDNIYFSPPSDYNGDVTLYYYEAQGPLTTDAQYTRTLRYAPGLYLYGALLQAQAYLIGDERIAVWEAQYREIMVMVNGMTDEDEVGGSTVTVRNIYS